MRRTAWLLVASIVTIDCGGEGDMGVIANDQFIEDDQEMRQAGNTAWDYSASSARLIGAGVAKSCDDNTAMGKVWRVIGRMSAKILELPLSQVAYGASRMIRVHILLERDAAEARCSRFAGCRSRSRFQFRRGRAAARAKGRDPPGRRPTSQPAAG